MTDVEIRPAVPADAAALAVLGATTFAETFAPDNDAEDMARYLAESFSPEVQAAEITDPGGLVLVAASTADGALLAYAHLILEDVGSVNLKRLYVLGTAKGRGLGRVLVDRAEAEGRARGATRLWLGVWERNVEAIGFYERIGFRRTGSMVFDLGGDLQTDHVMERAIASGE